MVKLSLRVRCIKEITPALYPDVDFGKLGDDYIIQCILPNQGLLCSPVILMET